MSPFDAACRQPSSTIDCHISSSSSRTVLPVARKLIRTNLSTQSRSTGAKHRQQILRFFANSKLLARGRQRSEVSKSDSRMRPRPSTTSISPESCCKSNHRQGSIRLTSPTSNRTEAGVTERFSSPCTVGVFTACPSPEPCRLDDAGLLVDTRIRDQRLRIG